MRSVGRRVSDVVGSESDHEYAETDEYASRASRAAVVELKLFCLPNKGGIPRLRVLAPFLLLTFDTENAPCSNAASTLQAASREPCWAVQGATS